METRLCLWINKINVVKMRILQKQLQIQHNPNQIFFFSFYVIKISITFFTGMEKNPKIHMKQQKHLIAKATLGGRGWNSGGE